MRNVTIVVLFFTTALVLLGSLNFAEGAVSWNGFLKEIGFSYSEVYEVSGESVIPGSTDGSVQGNKVELRCRDGDWLMGEGRPYSMFPEPIDDVIADGLTISAQDNDIHELGTSTVTLSKLIGYDVTPRRNTIQQPDRIYDITVTVSGLCFSPTPIMQVGGEWQPTDTTALIIGYSVLNAYWIAPIGIGIGVGIYLVKRKIE